MVVQTPVYSGHIAQLGQSTRLLTESAWVQIPLCPSTMSDGKVPWSELTTEQKFKFAQLCRRFIPIEHYEDAEKYYGNKERLKRDAEELAGGKE